jgi:hypothetical protein
MMGPPGAIFPVLTALETWRAVYQRWWNHPCRHGDAAERPWTDAERDRLARLAGVDPGDLLSAADRLDRVAADVGDLGRKVCMIASEAGVGLDAAARSGALGAAIESEVAELTGLATRLRSDSGRHESWLVDLVRQVFRTGDGVQAGGGHRSVWLALREADEADESVSRPVGPGAFEGPERGEVARWRALDGLVDGHSAVLTVLRNALAAAGGRGGAVGGSCEAWGDGPDSLSAAAVWVSEGTPPTREIVVDQAYRDQVGQVWQPLPAAPALVPGVGPLMPGTEGTRTETDTGVRIAQLPDRPISRR